jgi:hypothetical protein
MTKAILITSIFIWAILAGVIGYDIYALLTVAPNDTISEVLGRSWSFQHATIPFAWGVVTGHLFWFSDDVSMQWLRLSVLGTILAMFIVFDILDWYDVIPILPVLVGVPTGRLCWPQKSPFIGSFFVWKKK